MRITIVIIALSIISLMVSACTKSQTFEQNPSAYLGNTGNCKQDNKVCPDGSIVGRSGPNCNFDACPSAPSGFCDYGSPSRNYKSDDTAQCTNLQITCTDGWTKFSDRCGCGCESPAWAKGGIYCDASERYYTVCHVNDDAPNVCGYTDPAIKMCSGKPCTQEYANECEACKDKDIILWKPGIC